jgi:hypothetical protein
MNDFIDGGAPTPKISAKDKITAAVDNFRERASNVDQSKRRFLGIVGSALGVAALGAAASGKQDTMHGAAAIRVKTAEEQALDAQKTSVAAKQTADARTAIPALPNPGDQEEPTPPSLSEQIVNADIEAKKDLPPSVIVPEGTPPPKDVHERNRFGKFEVPREGMSVDFQVWLTDADHQPLMEGDRPVAVNLHVEGLQQYRTKSEGGDGRRQYMYKYHPELNVTERSGPKHQDKPFSEVEVFNTHSGKGGPAEPLRELHDYKIKDGQKVGRTTDEAEEFRSNFHAVVELKWKDAQGKDQRQLAKATMHHISVEGKTAFVKADEEHNAHKGKPDEKEYLEPLVTDYFEDRDGIPDKFDPWNEYAVLALCGQPLADEAIDDSRPVTMQDNVCLFLKAIDDDRGEGKVIANNLAKLQS